MLRPKDVKVATAYDRDQWGYNGMEVCIQYVACDKYALKSKRGPIAVSKNPTALRELVESTGWKLVVKLPRNLR